VTVLFFVALEFILRGAGVQPILLSDDPFVGFAENVPHFVQQAQEDGPALRVTAPNKLRWFNPQEFPAQKAAGTYRIFCVGGSTTFGRPYTDATSYCGWLRAFLQAADRARRWEVVNAGGISYASYRVAALMKELAGYEPDLFIVYTGQNEFLEQRMYGNMADLPQAILRMGSLAGRLRTYAVLKKLRARSASKQQAAAREQYILKGDVDPVLEHTVGPASYVRDDALRRQIIDHYVFNLHRIVGLAEAAGAELLFVTPAVNLKDMSPFKSVWAAKLAPEQRARCEQLYAQAVRQMKAGSSAAARRALLTVRGLDPRHAGVQYELGRLYFKRREYGKARAAFVRALDEDVCPLRILPEMQTAYAQVAAQHGVPLVAFDTLLAESCRRQYQHDIAGREYFLDHVHPTIETHRFLALELLNHLIRRHVVRPGPDWGPARIEKISAERTRAVDKTAHAQALATLGKVFNWAGKFEESEKLLKRADRMMGGRDPEVYYALGNSHASRGQDEQAVRAYRTAIRLKSDHVSARNNLGNVLLRTGDVTGAIRCLEEGVRIAPNDADLRNTLALALAKNGKAKQAVQQYQRARELKPDDPKVRYNLGNTLGDLGRIDEAIASYRAALQLDARYARARYNLGNMLAKQGKFDEAAAEYAQVLELEPGNTAVLNNLGSALVELGKLEQALEKYRAVLRLEPDNKSARDNIKAVERLLKRK